MALATLAISACSTAAKVATAEAPPQQAATNNEQAAPATETNPVRSTDVNSCNLQTQLDEMQKQSVHFDFGEFAIKPEYRDLIQQRK